MLSFFGYESIIQKNEYVESHGSMWGLFLYIIAVMTGLLLFWLYDPKESEKIEEEVEHDEFFYNEQRRNKSIQLSSVFAVLGIDINVNNHFEAFCDHFQSFNEVSIACKRAGLEHSNLIIGVDFTASNEWQGRKTFSGNCLHKISGTRMINHYQKVIWSIGNTLKPFDEDNFIPAYGFGDVDSKDLSVFPFKLDDVPCDGFEEVLDRYNEIAKNIYLSGPTSFAPIINKAVEIVQETKSYHILVIIGDGQMKDEKATIDALVNASLFPLSIIFVGVGDGPWNMMEEFDHRLPKRKFDNFRFVDYYRATYKSKNPDTSLALQALMEIPDQYKMMKAMGYFEEIKQKSDIDSINLISSSVTSSVENSPSASLNSSPKHYFIDSDSQLESPDVENTLIHRSSNFAGVTTSV